MNFWDKIKKWLGGRQIQAKACTIYKIDNQYKIVSEYQLKSGLYILSTPIIIIPENVGIEEISDAIFSILEQSKTLTKNEEKQYQLGTKGLLKALKETSFKRLYSHSTSCSLRLENNRIDVVPYRMKKYYLESVDEEKITISAENKLEVAKQVIEILNIKFSPILK